MAEAAPVAKPSAAEVQAELDLRKAAPDSVCWHFSNEKRAAGAPLIRLGLTSGLRWAMEVEGALYMGTLDGPMKFVMEGPGQLGTGTLPETLTKDSAPEGAKRMPEELSFRYEDGGINLQGHSFAGGDPKNHNRIFLQAADPLTFAAAYKAHICS